MAETALRELYVKFEAKVEGAEQLDKLDASADKAAGSVEKAATKSDAAAKKAGGALAGLGAMLQGAFAAVAGSALVGGINATATELASLGKLAEQTGISVQELDTFSYIVGQAGGDAADFRTQIGFLQRSMTQLEKATSPQAAAFKALGIATDEADGSTRSLGALLPEVFQNFEKITDPAQQAAIATRLFGKQGLALLPVLRQGQEGFAKYRAEFERTGGPVTPEEIKRAQEYKKALGFMAESWKALREDLVLGALPALKQTVEFLSRGTNALREFLKTTTAAEHSVVAIAAVIATTLGGALRPYMGKALKFAGIFLAVDDLLAFLRGKQSVIGDILDAMFGYGTAATVQAWVADAIEQFQYFTANADGAYATLTNSGATWVQKSLAGVALLLNGSVNTFAAISEGWESILLDMTIAIDEWVLGVGTKWNNLVKKLGLPSLQVDDTKSALVNEEGLAQRKKRRDDLQQLAYERESGTGRFAGAEGEKARERYKEMPGWDGLTMAQRQANQDAQRNGAPAPFEPRATTAAGRALQAQTATIREGAAAGATATLNDNKTITLNFKEGTSDQMKAAVKQAVADALASDNRAALETLTQRRAP